MGANQSGAEGAVPAAAEPEQATAAAESSPANLETFPVDAGDLASHMVDCGSSVASSVSTVADLHDFKELAKVSIKSDLAAIQEENNPDGGVDRGFSKSRLATVTVPMEGGLGPSANTDTKTVHTDAALRLASPETSARYVATGSVAAQVASLPENVAVVGVTSITPADSSGSAPLAASQGAEPELVAAASAVLAATAAAAEKSKAKVADVVEAFEGIQRASSGEFPPTHRSAIDILGMLPRSPNRKSSLERLPVPDEGGQGSKPAEGLSAAGAGILASREVALTADSEQAGSEHHAGIISTVVQWLGLGAKDGSDSTNKQATSNEGASSRDLDGAEVHFDANKKIPPEETASSGNAADNGALFTEGQAVAAGAGALGGLTAVGAGLAASIKSGSDMASKQAAAAEAALKGGLGGAQPGLSGAGVDVGAEGADAGKAAGDASTGAKGESTAMKAGLIGGLAAVGAGLAAAGAGVAVAVKNSSDAASQQAGAAEAALKGGLGSAGADASAAGKAAGDAVTDAKGQAAAAGAGALGGLSAAGAGLAASIKSGSDEASKQAAAAEAALKGGLDGKTAGGKDSLSNVIGIVASGSRSKPESVGQAPSSHGATAGATGTEEGLSGVGSGEDTETQVRSSVADEASTVATSMHAFPSHSVAGHASQPGVASLEDSSVADHTRTPSGTQRYASMERFKQAFGCANPDAPMTKMEEARVPAASSVHAPPSGMQRFKQLFLCGCDAPSPARHD